MAIHNDLGKWGEDMAVEFLREKGHVLVERDWHSGHRDIDIITRLDDAYVFIEVKTRRSDQYGSPSIALDYRKRKNLMAAINHYLQYKSIDFNWHFDLITIVGTPWSGKPTIEHYEDIPLY